MVVRVPRVETKCLQFVCEVEELTGSSSQEVQQMFLFSSIAISRVLVCVKNFDFVDLLPLKKHEAQCLTTC